MQVIAGIVADLVVDGGVALGQYLQFAAGQPGVTAAQGDQRAVEVEHPPAVGQQAVG